SVLDGATEDAAGGGKTGVGLGHEVDRDNGCAAALELEGEESVRAANVEGAYAAEVGWEPQLVEDRELVPVRVVAGSHDAVRQVGLGTIVTADLGNCDAVDGGVELTVPGPRQAMAHAVA